MQPIIKAYPDTKIVLLHSSYPYTRDAGYLTAVYPNVFLDIGEVFPFVSADGQKDLVRQALELCPTNKIMWSCKSKIVHLLNFIVIILCIADGHWWPESFYLGSLQGRQALFDVRA